MCGIAGILSLDRDVRIEAAPVRAMADTLRHRGPDDDGLYLDPAGRVGLGFRRLSVIDLPAGGQPMANEDGTVWVVFNGEIYNFRELRERLSAAGHRFRTRCDTEVIVHAYEQYGDACFAELAGMFAIALWDGSRGRLILARDRLGQKPLHYACAGGSFYFGSELKAILAGGARAEIDPQSLHRYLSFQYVPAPWSIYRGFGKVLPGERVAIDAHRPFRLERGRFWSLPVARRFDGTYEDAKARLGELLTSAVEKRLVADVPLGAFLSGGVDSSIVVGLMRRLGGSPLRTFCIGFEDPRYDESAHAGIVARHFDTEHHEYTVTPRARDVLQTLAFHYDEPFADSSAIPTYYVSQWARRSVTVALTGDAGDECFAGYDRYLAMRLAERAGRVLGPLKTTVAAALGVLPAGASKGFFSRAGRFAGGLRHPPARRYLEWVAMFPPRLLEAGYRPAFRERLDLAEPTRWFEALFHRHAGGPVERAIFTDFHSYLPYDLLAKVDLASMAVGLECRSPFLDHELVEFAVSLPIEWRLGPRGGKRILKDWAAELLPRHILERRKRGFGVPIGEWFRGELEAPLRERILASQAVSRRVFETAFLERLIGEHASGRVNHAYRLWTLLMLELWAERWTPTLAR